jgi:hypothetical protein
MLNVVGAANTGYRLGLVGGKIGWQIPQTAWSHMLTAPDPLPLGPWVHIVATYDNQTMRLFLNGEEKGSLERPGAVQPSGNRLCLGTYSPGDSLHNFTGVLDEVRLYDRALSAQEVAEHYRQDAK